MTRTQASTPQRPALVHHYTLYISHGHVLARNSKGKLIDLGAVRDEAGRLSYRLDVGGVIGNHFETTEKLLQDVAAKLAFAYLDDQFTSLPDCVETLGIDAELDPYLEITLEDVTPHQAGADAPHIF